MTGSFCAATLVGAATFSALTLFGCGNSCADLQDICNTCRDPNQKAACERSVDEDSQDVCAQNIDAYRNICQ